MISILFEKSETGLLASPQTGNAEVPPLGQPPHMSCVPTREEVEVPRNFHYYLAFPLVRMGDGRRPMTCMEIPKSMKRKEKA